MKLKLIIPRVIRHSEEKNIVEILFQDDDNLISLLKHYLNLRFDLVFDEKGSCKGFAKVFHNDHLVESLSDIKLRDGDEVEIITSMSGG